MAGAKPKLLAGGNPQIAKGYGDGPVQSYIAAMPGWKQAAGRQIDSLIARNASDVEKAVKWNSPFYGNAKDSWFLSFHVFARFVRITFFRGISLEPLPPGTSKVPEVRYFDVREGDDFEAQLELWVKQAIKLPGKNM